MMFHIRVMVVEVMGRNAGWIALASGLAGGANVIIIPEISWKWDPIFALLRERSKNTVRKSCQVFVVTMSQRQPNLLLTTTWYSIKGIL